MNSTEAYHLAQRALADLKAAVHAVVMEAGDSGRSNAEIGRLLGIYHGHSNRGADHQGHIPRVLLELMKMDGVVEQAGEGKRWRLRSPGQASTSTDGDSERDE